MFEEKIFYLVALVPDSCRYVFA